MIKRLVNKAAVVGVGMVALAAGCAQRQAPTTQPVAEANNPNVRRNWVADLKLRNDEVESMHLRGDRVFVYTEGNRVMALSRGGGSIQWGSQVGEAHTQVMPPVVLGDRVVFPVNTRLFVYNTAGIPQRTIDLPFAMHAPAVGEGDVVYVGADYPRGARVSAVDVTRPVGAVRWEFLLRGPMSAAPALYEEIVYVGGEDNRVYAVRTDRSPVWGLEGFAFQTAGRILADVKADEYAVYVASTDTKLYALDRISGRIKWTYYAERPLTTSPAVTADTVYQFAPARGLVAIAKAEGQFNRRPKWEAADAVQVLSVGARRVYVRLRNGTVGALDKETGDVVWRGTRRYAKFATNLRDATIFVSTADGEVHSYLPVGETAAAPATTRPAAAAPAAAE